MDHLAWFEACISLDFKNRGRDGSFLQLLQSDEIHAWDSNANKGTKEDGGLQVQNNADFRTFRKKKSTLQMFYEKETFVWFQGYSSKDAVMQVNKNKRSKCLSLNVKIFFQTLTFG